jgi:hypothetical protein
MVKPYENTPSSVVGHHVRWPSAGGRAVRDDRRVNDQQPLDRVKASATNERSPRKRCATDVPVAARSGQTAACVSTPEATVSGPATGRRSPAVQPDVPVTTLLVSADANWLSHTEIAPCGISAELQNTGISGGSREVASDAIAPRALPLIRAADAQHPCTGASYIWIFGGCPARSFPCGTRRLGGERRSGRPSAKAKRLRGSIACGMNEA